jgi:triosephosphate isomerase
MIRTPFVAGNWKMNTDLGEAVRLVGEMKDPLHRISGVEKVICPPFISLASVKNLIDGTTIKLGAQNMYFEEKGAFTGEISPLMLKGLCQFVIIGHSERRLYFGETDEMVNKKLKAAVGAGLAPILCVGERLQDREEGRTEEVVTTQLVSGLDKVPADSSLVVAYEPVWAIGTGRAATGLQAQETIALVRSTLKGLLGSSMAEQVRILYGGSVTAANILEFATQNDIDGALVGGACLKPQEFVSIVEQTAALRRGP